MVNPFPTRARAICYLAACFFTALAFVAFFVLVLVDPPSLSPVFTVIAVFFVASSCVYKALPGKGAGRRTERELFDEALQTAGLEPKVWGWTGTVLLTVGLFSFVCTFITAITT